MNDSARVWELASKISVAILASRDDQKPHSPPMSAHVARDENAIYVLADGRHHKDDDIRKFPTVCLAPSADDPNICVLKVEPTHAEYWDTPGKVVSTVKMAVGAMTGSRPVIGDNRKVAM